MNRVALRKISLRAETFIGWSRHLHRGLLTLFLVQLALVVIRELVPDSAFAQQRWPDGLLAVLAAAVTLSALARRLPAQNVILAAAIIAVMGSAAHILDVLTAMPFGPLIFTDKMGQLLFQPLPWAIPCLWVVALLNARGVGRLILRPWRKTRAYGFWLMGLTALLAVTFDLGLEPYAVRVRHFWFWGPTRGGLDWYSAPWINFIGWAMTSLLILAFATPSLMNKKPIKSPPNYHPLIVWLSVNALFAIGTARHGLWLATAVILASNTVVGVFAIKGGRW